MDGSDLKVKEWHINWHGTLLKRPSELQLGATEFVRLHRHRTLPGC